VRSLGGLAPAAAVNVHLPVAGSQAPSAPAGTPCSFSSAPGATNPGQSDQSLYKRQLQHHETIPFSSKAGKLILMECIGLGGANAYFPIAEQFVTQSSPPLCGPATIAMVLNSLAVDPQRVWKAPWRWYTEEMLVACLSQDWSQGLTMHEFAHLAECNGTIAKMYVAGEPGGSLEDFRTCVRRVCTDEDPFRSRLAVSFSRSRLGQTGTCGHYSPIAAYHCEKDSVLIMDVARFKYPPFWVPVPLLWEAMNVPDSSTGSNRGFFEIEKNMDGQSRHNLCGSAGREGTTHVQDSAESPRQAFKRLLANGSFKSVVKGADANLHAFVKLFLANSETVSKALRPLSHFMRMEFIRKPKESEITMNRLRKYIATLRGDAQFERRQLEAVWPSHPQISVELTTLVILACTEHIHDLSSFELKNCDPQLRQLIRDSAMILGITPTMTESSLLSPCKRHPVVHEL